MKILTAILAPTLCCAQFQEIAASRIRAHTKLLASDLMEGRGVGTRGDQLATQYLAAQLELAGAKPAGDNGAYFQHISLVGVEPQPSSSLSASGAGKSVSPAWLDGFVGNTMRQQQDVRFDGEAIFMGHGITAPEFGWDDYKDVDVGGKVVVLFTNEPPSEDPKFFGGRALTYYGRWTYKLEQAARKGALACIIIHTTPTAGYGWDVVRGSWSKEGSQVKLAAGEYALAFAGWVTTEAGNSIAALAGRNVDELLKAADTRGFKPFPLGIRLSGSIQAKVRAIQTVNVAGIVEGSDPALKNQAVMFSAHWDHLGMSAQGSGDRIYNGAVDNATGCAMVLEMARAWSSLQIKPRRSAIFLFVTAEESGLLGSEYYGRHPFIPAGRTALALNFDAFYPFGRTNDVVVSGAERTTAWPIVQEAARRFKLEIQPDPRPEQGSYYRSDHFPLARVGIPAFSIHGGNNYAGKPAGYGEQVFKEFNTKNYHQPSDEYSATWDFAGMEQMAQFGFLIGLNAANQQQLPTWREGDEFLPARQQSQR
jgi:Zn-dependent M28 family amino/carboxypeptidase